MGEYYQFNSTFVLLVVCISMESVFRGRLNQSKKYNFKVFEFEHKKTSRLREGFDGLGGEYLLALKLIWARSCTCNWALGLN